MGDGFTWPRGYGANPGSVKIRLPIVDAFAGVERNKVVLIDVGGIGARGIKVCFSHTIFQGPGGKNASRGTASKIRSRRGSIDLLARAIFLAKKLRISFNVARRCLIPGHPRCRCAPNEKHHWADEARGISPSRRKPEASFRYTVIFCPVFLRPPIFRFCAEAGVALGCIAFRSP
jgi:hypothetical protein